MPGLKKQLKNRNKEQAKVDRLSARIAAQESEANALEERPNSTKPWETRKELESKMQREKEQLQDIIQEESTTPSSKRDAYE